MTDKFAKQIALYSQFNGNDLRAILLLCGSEMRAKQLSDITHWDKGNTSRLLKKLVECGVVKRKETEDGVYYKTDTNWVAPEIHGQIKLNLKT